ncbi:MAG TPA: hypothetical protein VFS09_11705 [Candidatus Eisenbacteria bacterium]|nr:hypothetical protein [Candidatus Eisenbacteria bacterium]
MTARARLVAAAAALGAMFLAAASSAAPARPAASTGPRPAPGAPLSVARDASTPAHGGSSWLSWGGHAEIRLAEDRVRGTSNPEWFSFGRVNGFVRTRITPKWAFAGEGTWDRGTDDFVMERLELAFRWKPTLLAHGGIFPLPLGRTNLEHDAPRNEFAEHSLVATQLVGVPNAMLGAGVRGASGAGRRTIYELDLVTGLSDGLLYDAAGGTRLPMGRNNYGDQNGVPALVGRLAFHPGTGREWGIAALSGPYNETKINGVTVDGRRWAHLVVADGTTAVAGFTLAAEAGVAFIDVPPGLNGLYAEDQWGASVEAIRSLSEPLFGRWENSALRAAVRADAVDLDRGMFGDSRHRISASLNVHRKPYAVARLGWYYEIQRDRFDNETPMAGVTFTAASYF